ncbi:acyl-CoA thioesterase [Acetivibrio saccincola]|uniref:4-hydroxybenzoyl-CoA thioesterase n=1 Tax=Acetivibrio saccincola TaxID=1677857 RepID=A0A2S8RDT0_9FIRM|nr:thioesterase family protein [Acetivibrio saccincola]NLW26354.1 acyl-CoA thioesterase [Acetivibrio saccincola]PQQ67956.1 4-hydroxybenzoyl-CoA thioesterase [Acetivibrio saccincola]HOA96525.1 thioesterase family protein [Acetivibrio saccincola]HQD28343.1 thioesterase family protein [Acetivibrio saccincola]
MLITETNLIVRYAETDQMGIVHHSNYPIWFEAARTDYIKKMGLPYSKIEERGFLLPLIELNCKYKSAAKYEDEIVVKTQLKKITYTRVTFYYEVIRKRDGELLTTGETMHVWTDKNLKPVNIKKHALDIYELLSKNNQ